MFFTLDEIVRWLGLTIFEIWINLLSLLAFTILFVVNFNSYDLASNNWWAIFFPLFTADALNAYFCIIVFIRMLIELPVKVATLRICWSSTFLFMTFSFKFLLCKKLLGQLTLEFSEIFAPLYVLLQLIAIRACQQS